MKQCFSFAVACICLSWVAIKHRLMNCTSLNKLLTQSGSTKKTKNIVDYQVETQVSKKCNILYSLQYVPKKTKGTKLNNKS